MPTPLRAAPKLSAKLGSSAFVEDPAAHFRWMHEHAPVCRASMGLASGALISGYDDCAAALKDPRLVRDRRLLGKSRLPLPLPRSVKLAIFSMIDEDGADHRRLRGLVHKAFTPRALAALGQRVETLSEALLDDMAPRGQVDLIPSYSLPIPTTVIRELLGVDAEEMPRFVQTMSAFNRDYGLRTVLSLLFRDMPRLMHLVEGLIERKRRAPEDDILSALCQAEEDGDRLSHDELISMTCLLIVGGFETTVHLITNAVLTLLRHPAQLAELRAALESSDDGGGLLDRAIEEVLRHSGPVQGTKLLYAVEDMALHDVEISRGTIVFVCTGAANRDPRIFERPDEFDIHRPRHKHLALGHGPHFCLGAALARLETKIALRNLFRRFPALALALPEAEIRPVAVPLWKRHRALPLELGASSRP